ncbi:transposase, partial [Candidatus Pacearchaeota archaeon]
GSRSATLTVEQLLRIFIYKQLFKLSYRRLEEELHENIGVKRFTRLYSPEFDSWRGF